MPGIKIFFYILTAFIAGTLTLVYIQYNSSKNINTLINGNHKYLDEYKINSDLRELEKDVVRIESNISDFVSTNNTDFIKGLNEKMLEVQNYNDQLQQVADDETTVRLIDELDTVVQEKLAFGKAILDSFNDRGQVSAENLINTLKGKKLMDSVYLITDQIKESRHNLIKRLNDLNIRSGQKAERLNYVLIALTLVSAAALFWYIISIIQKLIYSERRVKEGVRVKENFIANISHEIRTPMNAIVGFTALLERRNLDEESKEYLRTIQKASENLLTIINDLLDLSKIEAGMMRIESTPFSIRALIYSVEVMFSTKAAEKNLQLYTHIDENVPEILEGDATRLTQVLVNLIGNALKFTNEGSITIRISNEGTEGSILRTGIKVKDTGIGIEKSKQGEIFNRFQQADDAVTRHYGGTGLGLSIVKELVALQHGTISVESEPGKGATFIIMLPYKIAAEQKQNVSLPDTGIKIGYDFPDKRILVVEDNEVNQSLVKHLFNEWHLQHDLAHNGKEAIQKLTETEYDLILMDIQMPEMDGYSATRKIREHLRLATPIVAMTAHALAGEREKRLSYGMNDYISKPIREEQLHKLISRFIGVGIEEKEKNEMPIRPDTFKYIHLEYMKEISSGNKEYEKTVSEQFIEAIPEDLEAIKNAWKDNNLTELRQLAHNMKTTISVMGLTDQLQSCLETLEYDDLSVEKFSRQFTILQAICNEALLEAKRFYSTI
ncbi:MAG TPA: response regulator [Chitinophagaceae bacterium]|jgi:signal transduction histidine kinase/CheY-like chemotaxis protein